MSRPDPIQYAERLYAAIRAANFSPISFLAFGSAVKDGVDLRRMPRIAAEPFMRVVGEMLDLEERAASQRDDIIEADTCDQLPGLEPPTHPSRPDTQQSAPTHGASDTARDGEPPDVESTPKLEPR